jgi:hypothetical protein
MRRTVGEWSCVSSNNGFYIPEFRHAKRQKGSLRCAYLGRDFLDTRFNGKTKRHSKREQSQTLQETSCHENYPGRSQAKTARFRQKGRPRSERNASKAVSRIVTNVETLEVAVRAAEKTENLPRQVPDNAEKLWQVFTRVREIGAQMFGGVTCVRSPEHPSLIAHKRIATTIIELGGALARFMTARELFTCREFLSPYQSILQFLLECPGN